MPSSTYGPLEDLISLRGRTAVVTGAGRGIGAAMAIRLAEAGATVVVTDINEQNAQNVREAIEAAGGRALALRLDVTDAPTFDAILDRIAEESLVPDIWVNNAGTYPVRATVDLTVEQWDLAHAQNLRSVFLGSQAAAKRMIANDLEGVIINVSSVAGVRLAPANPADYAAAKAGVTMFTKNLGAELGPQGIRVVGLAPGFVVTPGVEEDAAFSQDIGKPASTPRLGRQLVPDDIAAATVFLASSMARMITSEILVVDGGGSWAMPR